MEVTNWFQTAFSCLSNQGTVCGQVVVNWASTQNQNNNSLIYRTLNYIQSIRPRSNEYSPAFMYLTPKHIVAHKFLFAYFSNS